MFRKNDRVAFSCGGETCFGRVYNVAGRIIYVQTGVAGEIVVMRDRSGIRRMSLLEIVKYDWFGKMLPSKIPD